MNIQKIRTTLSLTTIIFPSLIRVINTTLPQTRFLGKEKSNEVKIYSFLQNQEILIKASDIPQDAVLFLYIVNVHIGEKKVAIEPIVEKTTDKDGFTGDKPPYTFKFNLKLIKHKCTVIRAKIVGRDNIIKIEKALKDYKEVKYKKNSSMEQALENLDKVWKEAVELVDIGSVKLEESKTKQINNIYDKAEPSSLGFVRGPV